jgi:hypothetical protein
MLHVLPTGEGELTPREIAAWATRIQGFEGLLAAGLVAPEESRSMFERLRMDIGAMGQACAQAFDTGNPVPLHQTSDPLQGAEDAARILTYLDRVPNFDGGEAAAIEALAKGLKERLEAVAKSVVP